MLLLGRLRQELQGTLNGDRIKALRLDMLKEHLWQSTRELARSIIGIDENGNYLPSSETLRLNFQSSTAVDETQPSRRTTKC